MKKAKVAFLALTIATAGLFAFTGIQTASIKGTVTPADAASKVWAVSSSDTLKASIEQGGTFVIGNAKAGTYRIIVEAKAPYKNQAKENVTVTDGQATDIGEIKLEQ